MQEYIHNSPKLTSLFKSILFSDCSFVLDCNQEFLFTQETELELLTDLTADDSLVEGKRAAVKRIYLALNTVLLVVEVDCER